MNALEKLTAQLAAQVDAELSSQCVQAHHHGRPIGYHNGCRGPLCKKHHRDRLRKPGSAPANPFLDAYLEERLREHKESLKESREQVA